VRDAVACESLGVPAVVIVLSSLIDIAVATARSAGAVDLQIVPLEASLFGVPRDEVRAMATPVAAAAVTALTPPSTIV
jgi:hypothetical protein